MVLEMASFRPQKLYAPSHFGLFFLSCCVTCSIARFCFLSMVSHHNFCSIIKTNNNPRPPLTSTIEPNYLIHNEAKYTASQTFGNTAVLQHSPTKIHVNDIRRRSLKYRYHRQDYVLRTSQPGPDVTSYARPFVGIVCHEYVWKRKW